MDEAQVAQITMKFMERCQVQGSEVMHFMACMQWLEGKTRGPAQAPDAGPEVEMPAPSKRTRKG